jgi:hypothetical protein
LSRKNFFNPAAKLKGFTSFNTREIYDNTFSRARSAGGLPPKGLIPFPPKRSLRATSPFPGLNTELAIIIKTLYEKGDFLH